MASSKGGVLSPFTEQVEGLLSRSKSSYPEEEIDNWLQYPLDYTLERGYFSDLFGRLTSFLGNAKPDGDQGAPITTEGAGRRGTSTVSQNAKDSLALGAGRTSGLVLLEPAETCNKVKTIMQRAPCLQSETSAQIASPLGIQHENCEPFHPSLHSRGLSKAIILADKHPAYGALHNCPPHCLWSSSVYPIPPTHDVERLNLSEEAAAGSTLCDATHLINSDRISKASAAQAQIIHSPGNHYSLITENHMRDASLHTASTGHWESRRIAPYDASNSVSPGALCREGIRQDTCGKVPDACVPTCSGGSRTSAEMSAKETSSLGKRKMEDYDNLIKNVEVDSAEIIQQQRRPSKRTRVAESHNLSEKRRRNRINEKLKTLQELIPNSSKTDKASILDEAIEYLKALQSQLQMMSSRSGMKLSSMGFTPGMQHIQMAHSMSLGFPLVHTGMGINMGIGLMDVPQGMDERPFQALSVPSAHSNPAYPVRASLPSQACSQPYPSREIASSELWPLQQPPAQAYPQMSIEPQTVSIIEQGEQLSALKVSEDR